MSISNISAAIRCDGCNTTFSVKLDRAQRMNGVSYSDIDDYVEDIVRGGNAEAGCTSVQANHLLCESCTAVVDAAYPEDVTPNYDQVCAALNKAAGV